MPYNYNMTEAHKTGKLSHSELYSCLAQLKQSDEVEVGPMPGIDAAVINSDNIKWVYAQDPVTYATDKVAYLSFIINANDVVCMGGVPEFFLSTFLFPNKVTPEEIEEAFSELQNVAEHYNVSVVGGHTEITPGLKHTIAMGTMFGRVRGHVLKPSLIRDGDYLIQIGDAGVEGVSVIARHKKTELKKFFSEQEIDYMEEMLYTPGISIVENGLKIQSLPSVKCMHDPTEGGIYNAIFEMTAASRLGVIVDNDRIMLNKYAEEISRIFDINPYKLLSSGTLLVSTDNPSEILNMFPGNSSVLGQFNSHKSATIQKDGKYIALKEVNRDEILKIL